MSQFAEALGELAAARAEQLNEMLLQTARTVEMVEEVERCVTLVMKERELARSIIRQLLDAGVVDEDDSDRWSDVERAYLEEVARVGDDA